jgi:hypothetical protein
VLSKRPVVLKSPEFELEKIEFLAKISGVTFVLLKRFEEFPIDENNPPV